MTESEIAEIRQEIVKHEIRHERTVRECRYLEGQIFQLKQILIVVSPENREESFWVCRNRAWQDKADLSEDNG